jgi:hypothetical protein
MVNAIGRFVLGLMHEESHLGQIGEIVRQARAVRGTPLEERNGRIDQRRKSA